MSERQPEAFRQRYGRWALIAGSAEGMGNAYAERFAREGLDLVIINPKTCSGCMSCVDACPYGAIFYNKDLNMAQKCTGCAQRLTR